MPFHLFPPSDFKGDTAAGVQAAQAVFEANDTLAEIAVFGHWAAEKRATRSRSLPMTSEERRLADVYALAKASAIEACSGALGTSGWEFDVSAPQEVYLFMPGASVAAHQQGVEAALAVFRAGGISPQGAAIGAWERELFERRGFRGPEPSVESCRAASLFEDASTAAFAACGGAVPGRQFFVDGTDDPHWDRYKASSAVLTWTDDAAERV